MNFHSISCPLCLVVTCLFTPDAKSKVAGQSPTGQANLVVVAEREVRWLLLREGGAAGRADGGADEESNAGVAGMDLERRDLLARVSVNLSHLWDPNLTKVCVNNNPTKSF